MYTQHVRKEKRKPDKMEKNRPPTSIPRTIISYDIKRYERIEKKKRKMKEKSVVVWYGGIKPFIDWMTSFFDCSEYQHLKKKALEYLYQYSSTEYNN